MQDPETVCRENKTAGHKPNFRPIIGPDYVLSLPRLEMQNFTHITKHRLRECGFGHIEWNHLGNEISEQAQKVVFISKFTPLTDTVTLIKNEVRDSFGHHQLPPEHFHLFTTHKQFRINDNSIVFSILYILEYEQALFHCFSVNWLTMKVSALAFSLLTAIAVRLAFSKSFMFCFPNRFNGVTTILIFVKNTSVRALE